MCRKAWVSKIGNLLFDRSSTVRIFKNATNSQCCRRTVAYATRHNHVNIEKLYVHVFIIAYNVFMKSQRQDGKVFLGAK